jgi:hypothetical protein
VIERINHTKFHHVRMCLALGRMICNRNWAQRTEKVQIKKCEIPLSHLFFPSPFFLPFFLFFFFFSQFKKLLPRGKFFGACLFNFSYIFINLSYLCISNSNWFDTRWQQYSTQLHTDSTQNTESGTYITIKEF